MPASAAPSVVRTDALCIGGGPAGLASALMLAAHGHKVTVVERHSQLTHSDPDRSYVYAIDGRGRQFTDKYGITEGLAAASVDTQVVNVTRVFPSGKAVASKQVIKDDARVVFWLPRDSFMQLLEQAATSGPHAASITILRNTEATAVRRTSSSSSSSGSGLEVQLQDFVSGQTTTVLPQLLIGCDGINSIVRSSMQDWAAAAANKHGDASAENSSAAAGRFSMEEFPSLSTGLRFKVLQLPPNPTMADGAVLHNNNFCLLAGKTSQLIGGSPLRLGLLPIKNTAAGRTANLITLPDHPVWNVHDAEGMYTVLEQAFPQANWRQLVPQSVMAHFAASEGGAFPAPQYSRGMSMVLDDDAAAAVAGDAAGLKGSGAVLLGDSAHCFPPDLGQGVNSALEDVCVLEQQLQAARGDLSAALPAFEQQRLPDSAALAKLVQIGFPLQYNQYPLLRVLWTARFLAQMVLHKLLPFLIAPPLFLMVQDPAQRYSDILAATERSRNVLAVLAAALVAAAAWLLRKAILAVAALGAAAV